MSQPEESGQPQRSEPPERLAIAGAGTIACGLALAAAAAGVETAVWARSDQSRQRAEDRIEAERDRAGTGAAGIVVTCELDDLSEATLAVEAVAEEQEAKEQVLRALAERVGEHALLASTTSSLAIEALAQAVGHPDRFFGLHVFNPVLKMELVEVCFPDEATPAVRERASAFCAALGKTAIEVPDEPGFVVNRLLFPYLFDAVRLLERSGLEPEQIDACMKLGASYPMGPLELLDFVGIDVADAIGEALHADTGDPSHRPPGRIKQLVGEGRVGRKAGRGFYDYRAARNHR
jgi:3-hydroxybutyryl-CoA dehydrogenase